MTPIIHYTEEDTLLLGNKSPKWKNNFRDVSLDSCNNKYIILSIVALYCITFYSPLRNWYLTEKYDITADRALNRINNLTEAAAKNNSKSTHNLNGCESTMLLIRHCEDLGGHIRYQDGSKHCSYLGFERSVYLSTLFGDGKHDERWPLPSRLYGLWKGNNKRQYEILQPLSEKSHINITMFPFPGNKDLVNDFFTVFEQDVSLLCGKVAVIAWKHKFIRPLAAALGCGQEQGCPDYWDDYDFDSVWEIKYVYEPEGLRATPGHSIKKHANSQVTGWKIYGSQTREYFDALEFDHDVGDYSSKSNKTPRGGNWMHNHDKVYQDAGDELLSKTDKKNKHKKNKKKKEEKV